MDDAHQHRPDRRQRPDNQSTPTKEVVPAKADQHDRDGKLHGETEARWNDNLEHDNGTAHQENCHRVADTPERADAHCVRHAPLPGDDRGHRDDVVRVGGVAHPEDDAEQQRGKEVGHGGQQIRGS